MKKNHLLLAFVAASTLALSGCSFSFGPGPSPDTSSSESPTSESTTSSQTSHDPGPTTSTSSSSYTPSTSRESSSETSGEAPDWDDVRTDINDLNDDLEWDDGEICFDDVTIKLWSVINQPDNEAMKSLVSKFNKMYSGQITIDMTCIAAETYYSSLEQAWNFDKSSMPDAMIMHCEKVINYGVQNYMYPFNEILDKVHSTLDFSLTFDNVDRTNLLDIRGTEWRFGIPLDCHGFLYSIRQDLIKKNELGFDNNTRFIPRNNVELQDLLTRARAKADSGTFLYRDIGKMTGQEKEANLHAWKTLSVEERNNFWPAYTPNPSQDALTALYADDGKLSNIAQDTIVFGDNFGINNFLNDCINRGNAREVYTGSYDDTDEAMFQRGSTLMFSQGPWWASQTYSPQWNNESMRKTSYQGVPTGISEEDANDPILSYPYVACNPSLWRATDDMPEETRSKWYGNGHSFCLSRTVTSLTKAAALYTFAHFVTQQEVNEGSGEYYLTEHCATGHLPAWKNVWESAHYQAEHNSNLTLQALGNPENIITLEGLRFEQTFVGALENVFNACFETLRALDESKKNYNYIKGLADDVIFSAQAELDMLIG